MWNAISDTPVSWFGLKMFNLQSTISHVIEIAPDAYKINVEPDRCVKKKNESRNWTNFRQYQQFDYPLYQFPCRYVSTISPFILCIFCYKYIPVHIEGRPKSEKVPPHSGSLGTHTMLKAKVFPIDCHLLDGKYPPIDSGKQFWLSALGC